MKKAAAALLTLLLFALLPLNVGAQEMEAKDLTGEMTISGTGYDSFVFLQDGNVKIYKNSASSARITLEHPEGIARLYLLFDLEYGAYTIRNNGTGQCVTAGEMGFLHELVDLTAVFGAAPDSVTLIFDSGKVRLSEIYAFSEGALPDFVQEWEAPLDGKADLVLFPTHGDDEQLYFAGLLPYYAGELKYNVQVVYMTDHRNLTKARTHEMLNGLWAVGVRAYPVFGKFADFRIDDKNKTYSTYKGTYGLSKDDLLSFVVEQVRRFKPLVAVGHDPEGEYGHGMHMVYSELLQRSVAAANDPERFPESAAKYGVWEIKKVYLHLYEENPIVMDYDQPLESFGGMTAFQVTQQLGFPCHKTQQGTMFPDWIYGKDRQITLASQIEDYSPCKFGLYHSAVGGDVRKNDFFENLVNHAQRARVEAALADAEQFLVSVWNKLFTRIPPVM